MEDGLEVWNIVSSERARVGKLQFFSSGRPGFLANSHWGNEREGRKRGRDRQVKQNCVEEFVAKESVESFSKLLFDRHWKGGALWFRSPHICGLVAASVKIARLVLLMTKIGGCGIP